MQCSIMGTRRCPSSYGDDGCGERLCARFESDDETPWVSDDEQLRALPYRAARQRVPELPPHPGMTWRWPTQCKCGQDVGPWDPNEEGSPLTHIRGTGAADFKANRDHEVDPDPVS